MNAPKDAPLDEVMLAMDVVDTLRHRVRLVERELDKDGQDTHLVERLKSIYAAQGIDVPDHILSEGVNALREDRFTYVPTRASFQRRLAGYYVKRDKWGVPLLGTLAALFVVFFVWKLFFVWPQERSIEALPETIAQLRHRVASLSAEEGATHRAAGLADNALAALATESVDEAKTYVDELSLLATQLQQSYQLRVMSRPGELSGVWRIPDSNQRARNYYVIVEPVSASGKVIPISVTNEENSKTVSVKKFGVRVSQAIFASVQRDKQDDGIIQSNIIGHKQRGKLKPDYSVPVLGGVITEW